MYYLSDLSLKQTDMAKREANMYPLSKRVWMVLSKTFQNCWTMNETLDFITSLFAKKEKKDLY